MAQWRNQTSIQAHFLTLMDERIAAREAEYQELRRRNQEEAAKLAKQDRASRRVLTVEAQEDHVNRLHYQSQEQRKTREEQSRAKLYQPTGHQLGMEEQEEMVQRLYYSEAAKAQSRADERLSKLEETAISLTGTHEPIDREELEASVHRLHDQEAEYRRSKREALQQKYSPPLLTKSISLPEIQASAQRLCNESVQHKKASRDKLLELHLAKAPPCKKLRVQQQKEVADRLFKSGQA
uniref:Uncharacterized protein n=1 Tax=Eutreptiella gymnastica TaxID=73025 RepID=A0A6U8K5V8_9EUGL|mmetsp:Transcript_69388/g.122537  ORF Transcript_69388/g.122537 Transcript_69388/m.122537 type:complete len:238 (+) Transcript_69388:83-796(+)